MVATITIYGADTDVALNPIVADNTAIEVLPGYGSVELNVDWVEPKPYNEGEIQTYLNSFQFAVNGYRLGYNLVSEWVDFPSSSTALTTDHAFLDVINFKYHWICLNDYPYTTYSSPTTKSLRVNIEDYDLISEGGKKYWRIILKEVKQNMARS